MNRIGSRLALGTVTALLVFGGAGAAQADGVDAARPAAAATGRTEAPEPAPEPTPIPVVGPLTNDWG
ncbi:hypothetical protein [Streptomyces sp. NPDC048669]|uniref:hypothetical protein n=1 Tax=Streptomyces sp. NPDC048669 TaxID=3155267 RepID=UPI003422279E